MNITYVKLHNVLSQEVSESDYEKVFEVAEEIFKLCHQAHGYHKSAYAIAHSQVERERPLRFFVTHNGDVFINPKITRHTQVPVQRFEGCMSYPNQRAARVLRFNKIEITYRHFNVRMAQPWQVSEEISEALNGLPAQIIQHEIDHMEGKYVYPIPEEKEEVSALSQNPI